MKPALDGILRFLDVALLKVLSGARLQYFATTLHAIMRHTWSTPAKTPEHANIAALPPPSTAAQGTHTSYEPQVTLSGAMLKQHGPDGG